MSANDTIPADLGPEVRSLLGLAILFFCYAVIPMVCFFVGFMGSLLRDKLPPFADHFRETHSLFTWPFFLLTLHLAFGSSLFALQGRHLETLNISHLAFLSAGAAAAISIPHFLLPATWYWFPPPEQGFYVKKNAPRPSPPRPVQPSKQVPGEESTVPAQGRNLGQGDRSWSLDLESAFASEKEQRLL